MLTIEKTEYLEEIREQVCSPCVEKPPGGPPCEPLGKLCGIELHLTELIDSIHQIPSPLLVVQAIETVDQRRRQTEHQRDLAEPQEGHVPDWAAVARAYDKEREPGLA